MQLGIIGLPGSGKTTIFNALTGEHLPIGDWGAKGTHTAIVDVPDQRAEALVSLFKARKKVLAKVTYVDTGGLKIEGAGLPGALANVLAQMDGLLHVVRVFEDENLPHALDSIDPRRDVQLVEDEFILHDMIVVERRLGRLAEERQKGSGRDRRMIEREIAIFERLLQTLGEGMPLRSLDLTPEEKEVTSGFGLLSRKPVLVVLNIGEGQTAPDLGPLPEGVFSVVLQGRLEMEIAQLPEAEARAFLEEYAIEQPGRHRVVQTSYEMLKMLSFFSADEKEVHVWTLRQGKTALEAADAIHSDLARGFIRAEIIAWDALIELGGIAEARASGKLRVEGKNYLMADGEVIIVRFNI